MFFKKKQKEDAEFKNATFNDIARISFCRTMELLERVKRLEKANNWEVKGWSCDFLSVVGEDRVLGAAKGFKKVKFKTN